MSAVNVIDIDNLRSGYPQKRDQLVDRDDLWISNIDGVETGRDATFNIDMFIEEIEIEFNFESMVSGTVESNRARIKDIAFKMIEKNPGIKTSEILDLIEYDEWELLNILDELAEEGKVK